MENNRGTGRQRVGKPAFRGGPRLGRRVFFRHAGAAVAGYFLLPVRPLELAARAAVSPAGTAKNCIFILMAGAPSHVDMFDLKEGPWTPAAFKPTSYGDLRWPQGLMPVLAGQIDSLVVLRSVRAWALVHAISQSWVQIARNPVPGPAEIAPHLGSVVSLELGTKSANKILPAFVSLNADSSVGAACLPPQHAPFYMTPGEEGLAGAAGRPVGEDSTLPSRMRNRLLFGTGRDGSAALEMDSPLDEMESLGFSARKLMCSPAVRGIFTLDAAERALYGNSAFGDACLTARNLLRAGAGTRFVQITTGGWDNHSDIYDPSGGIAVPAAQFDKGLGALIADLKNGGMLDETLIVAMGEFGRTPGALNAQSGRDHFFQQAVLMAGAKIRGGRAIGATDAEGRSTVEPGWSAGRVIRPEDIAATIYSAMGIDWTAARRDDLSGRGFEYIPANEEGRYLPVHELWS